MPGNKGEGRGRRALDNADDSKQKNKTKNKKKTNLNKRPRPPFGLPPPHRPLPPRRSPREVPQRLLSIDKKLSSAQDHINNRSKKKKKQSRQKKTCPFFSFPLSLPFIWYRPYEKRSPKKEHRRRVKENQKIANTLR